MGNFPDFMGNREIFTVWKTSYGFRNYAYIFLNGKKCKISNLNNFLVCDWVKFCLIEKATNQILAIYFNINFYFKI